LLIEKKCNVVIIETKFRSYLFLFSELTLTMALMKAALAWERFILKDLTTFARYAKVELTPPGPGDMGGLVRGVGGLVKDVATFKWAQASMKEVAVNTIVVTEIACWFFIGECIGKGSLVGYQV